MSSTFARLRMEEVDGGWEPAEGVKVNVVVRGGVSGGVITLGPVKRILTESDAWWVWMEEDQEVVWVPAGGVVMLSSKGGNEGGSRRRTGFA